VYSRGGSGAKEILTDLGRSPVVVAFDEPLLVVEISEFLEGLVEVFDVGEGVDPEELFLEGATGALDAAVAFGSANEGGPTGLVERDDGLVASGLEGGGMPSSSQVQWS
jgi:hypothetical protein